MSRVCLGKAGLRRDDDPATVDYLREQAPYPQYKGYSLRRDLCSFDSTLQEGNRMTICSWRPQSSERPQKFVYLHATLQISSQMRELEHVPRPVFGALPAPKF